jgi:predicted nuclease of predicted toxin-antitoxin system
MPAAGKANASFNYPTAMILLPHQGLPLSAAALLRDSGIHTIHVGEIGMSEVEDAEIIQRGREESAIAT